MKFLLTLCLSAAALCGAEAARPQPTTIPAGAKQIRPYTYQYTDSAGKTWIYRQTPFGVSRYEDRPEMAPAAAESYPYVKAHDAGDSVRFERRTPFGISRWERKKSELDEMERAVWERDQPHPSAQD